MDSQIIPIIKNENYDNLISGNINRFESFIFPNIKDIKIADSLKLTRDICILLKSKDDDLFAEYALETKITFGSRNKRIPMLRISKKSVSIWKFVNNLDKLDRAINELNDISALIEAKTFKVLVLTYPESLYTNNERSIQYILRSIEDNKLILFSYEFLEKNFLISDKTVNIERFLIHDSKLFALNF